MPAQPHTARSMLTDTRTEKRIEADIIKMLRSLGYRVTKTSQYAKPKGASEGTPDLYAMREPFPGAETDVPNVFWIEVKTARGTVSPSQAEWHADAEAAGVPVVVARSAADLLPTLRALGAPLR